MIGKEELSQLMVRKSRQLFAAASSHSVKSLDAGGYVKRQRFLFDSSRRAGTKLGSDLARCRRRRRCHRSLHAALLSPHQSPDTDPPDKKIEKDYSSCSAIPHPFNGVYDFSSLVVCILVE